MTRPRTEGSLRPMWRVASAVAVVLSLILGVGVGRAQGGETALGLGVGLAHPNDFPQDGLYFTASICHGVTRLLVLEPEFGFWQAAWESGGYSGLRRDISGNLQLLARTPAGRTRVSGGVGIGYHALHSEYRYPYASQLSHDSQKLGIHALLGVDVSVTRHLWLYGVGRYDLLKGEAQTVMKAYGGVRWQLS